MTDELEDREKKAQIRGKLKGELAIEKNMLRALLDHIPDSIFFKDKENRFARVSKAKAMEVGVSPGEVIGKTDFDFFPIEMAEKMFEDDTLVMKTERPVINKIEKISRHNGKERWVSATKVPWYDEEGNVIGTLGISRDLTEHWILWKRMSCLSPG